MITRKRLRERVEQMARDGIDISFHIDYGSVHTFRRLWTANKDKPLTGVMSTGQLWNWLNGFDAGFAQGLTRPPRKDLSIRIVHLLRFGFPLCRFHLGTPVEWPAGHTWVLAGSNMGEFDLDRVDAAMCTECQRIQQVEEGK